MFRFYVNERIDDKFVLTDEILRHIKVARVQEKNFISIFEGKFYVTKLEDNFAVIVEELNEQHDFEKEVILAAAYIDTKRFEWLIQKAAELGATKLIPMVSKNISKKLPSDIDKKLVRWNQIALNASEQSFRNNFMTVEMPMELKDVVRMDIPNKFIAHEKVNSTPEASLPQDSLFLVGPEGGFAEEEVKEALENNFKVISLGKRILRAETASMFILARIN